MFHRLLFSDCVFFYSVCVCPSIYTPVFRRVIKRDLIRILRVLERVWRRCVALYLELPALDVEEGSVGTSKNDGEP